MKRDTFSDEGINMIIVSSQSAAYQDWRSCTTWKPSASDPLDEKAVVARAEKKAVFIKRATSRVNAGRACH